MSFKFLLLLYTYFTFVEKLRMNKGREVTIQSYLQFDWSQTKWILKQVTKTFMWYFSFHTSQFVEQIYFDIIKQSATQMTMNLLLIAVKWISFTKFTTL